MLQLPPQPCLLSLRSLQAGSWPPARQAAPVNLLLLLGNDVHGHEHVQRVVHAAPDVLLVKLRAMLGPCRAGDRQTEIGRK